MPSHLVRGGWLGSVLALFPALALFAALGEPFLEFLAQVGELLVELAGVELEGLLGRPKAALGLGFAGAALLLAAVGVYGVTAQAVTTATACARSFFCRTARRSSPKGTAPSAIGTPPRIGWAHRQTRTTSSSYGTG